MGNSASSSSSTVENTGERNVDLFFSSLHELMFSSSEQLTSFDFEKFYKENKRKFVDKDNLELVPIENILGDDVVGLLLDFTTDSFVVDKYSIFSDRLVKMLEKLKERDTASYFAFFESTLGKFLAPNILTMWMDYNVSIQFKDPKVTRFISELFLQMCNMGYFRYYSSKKEILMEKSLGKVDDETGGRLVSETGRVINEIIDEKKFKKIAQYFISLRLNNVFEVVYVSTRMTNCGGIFIELKSLIQTQTIQLKDFIQSLCYNGIMEAEFIDNELERNKWIVDDNFLFEPLLNSFYSQDWRRFMSYFNFFGDNPFLMYRIEDFLTRNVEFQTLVNSFLLRLVGLMHDGDINLLGSAWDVHNLNLQLFNRGRSWVFSDIRERHAAGFLRRGYYKALEQLYEFSPFVLVLILKLGLYQLYDRKIIDHLVQKYINLLTLIVQDTNETYSAFGQNKAWSRVQTNLLPRTNSFSERFDYILDALSKYIRMRREEGYTKFHLTYIPCSKFAILRDIQRTLLFRLKNDLNLNDPMSNKAFEKYNQKCTKLFPRGRGLFGIMRAEVVGAREQIQSEEDEFTLPPSTVPPPMPRAPFAFDELSLREEILAPRRENVGGAIESKEQVREEEEEEEEEEDDLEIARRELRRAEMIVDGLSVSPVATAEEKRRALQARNRAANRVRELSLPSSSSSSSVLDRTFAFCFF